jgi:hypothetical protein
MKKVLGIAVAIMLCVSLVALAGGDKGAGKMGGTISKLDMAQKMMVVKDKDGKEWSIYWNDATKVEGGELKEGEMVHFKAAEQDGKMWASWVHVGKMEASKEKPKY